VLVATSLGARNGLLIRGGDVLQTASNVDTVVFDKTGTLTQGKPRVVNVQPQAGYTAKDVLQLAAAVECHSSHPLAQAIVSSAADATGSDLLSSDQSTFNQPAGAGIEGYVNGESVLVGSIPALQARGVSTHAQPLSLRNGALQEQEGYRRREEAVEALFKKGRNAHNAGPTLQASRTSVHVAHNAQYIGTITLADEMRSEAKQTVSLLKQAGVRNFPILSGDTQAAAEQLAGIIGIEQNHANGCVEPERKADIVQTLRNEGHTVAVVGDGINDAGALATADVGIAIGSGAAAANDAAGIVLLQDDLRLAADALRLSKRAMATVRANLGMSLLYNGVSIPLAAGAMLPVWGVSLSPSLAGGLMGISSVSVVTSSLSIKLWQPRSHFERKKDSAKAKNNSESAAASAAA
jgi:Cu2+-exporting ATPase